MATKKKLENMETRERLILPVSTKSIEGSILATFLYLNCLTLEDEIKKDVFRLDESIFSTNLKKSIAKKINECDTHEYSFVGSNIIESCGGTNHELEMTEIIGQLGHTLKIAKMYHDDLAKKKKIGGLI